MGLGCSIGTPEAIGKPPLAKFFNKRQGKPLGDMASPKAWGYTETIYIKHPLPSLKQVIKGMGAGDFAECAVPRVFTLFNHLVSQNVADDLARAFSLGGIKNCVASHQLDAQAKEDPRLFVVFVPGRNPENTVDQRSELLNCSPGLVCPELFYRDWSNLDFFRFRHFFLPSNQPEGRGHLHRESYTSRDR